MFCSRSAVRRLQDVVKKGYSFAKYSQASFFVSPLFAELGRDTLASKNESRHAAVRVSFSSLLVQRDQWDTYWGPKKLTS
jgi:hypothetical protein